MDRPLLMAMVLAILLILLALMYLGWRGRQRRQGSLGRPASVPDDAGPGLFAAHAFYVATTTAGNPLDRIAVGGLGYRSRAEVSLTGRGVVLSIPGQERIFVPAADLLALERATWTIDRVVEQGGMVLLRWRLRSAAGSYAEVDSYLRFIEPGDSDAFVAVATENLLHRAAEDRAREDSTPEGGPAQ